MSSYFDTLVCCYFAIARTPVLPRYSPSGIARGSCRALSLSLFSIHWKSYLEVLYAVVKLFPCPLSELSWSPPRSYLATPRSSIRLQSYLEVLYAQFWINETILSVHTAVWSFRGLICSYPEIFHALQSYYRGGNLWKKTRTRPRKRSIDQEKRRKTRSRPRKRTRKNDNGQEKRKKTRSRPRRRPKKRKTFFLFFLLSCFHL